MKCKCGGNLVPRIYTDTDIGCKCVSGADCQKCLKAEVTSDMTLEEWNKISKREKEELNHEE